MGGLVRPDPPALVRLPGRPGDRGMDSGIRGRGVRHARNLAKGVGQMRGDAAKKMRNLTKKLRRKKMAASISPIPIE